MKELTELEIISISAGNSHNNLNNHEEWWGLCLAFEIPICMLTGAIIGGVVGGYMAGPPAVIGGYAGFLTGLDTLAAVAAGAFAGVTVGTLVGIGLVGFSLAV